MDNKIFKLSYYCIQRYTHIRYVNVTVFNTKFLDYPFTNAPLGEFILKFTCLNAILACLRQLTTFNVKALRLLATFIYMYIFINTLSQKKKMELKHNSTGSTTKQHQICSFESRSLCQEIKQL